MISVYANGARYTAHRDGIRWDDMHLFGMLRSVWRDYAAHGAASALVHACNLNSEIAQREITAILVRQVILFLHA